MAWGRRSGVISKFPDTFWREISVEGHPPDFRRDHQTRPRGQPAGLV